MAILVLLIKRDVPQFVTVFVVIIFSFGGALHLSLIGYYNDDNLDTENNNETRYHIHIIIIGDPCRVSPLSGYFSLL